ncbi:hypothetical protein ABCR94_00240 [Streptomyces sp. 21So2-11]|uniref:hypothetical protein n=1 Tax=Streptomyces sp. 21So2-11 TaxID=3144408 RepID=UPI00321BF2BF
MTDKQLPENERVRLLLMSAAEPEGRIAPPGTAFTARARRSLLRRRLAVTTAALAAGAAAVAGTLFVGGATGNDEPPPAASAECLHDAVQKIKERQGQGYRPVYGTLREGRIRMDDGVTKSSAFRFDVDGALADGTGVPSTGPVHVWYPTAEVQLPSPGRYVLLLDRADRPDSKGAPLFHLAPEQALPLSADGRVQLRCADGSTGSVPQDRLRAAVNGA